MDIYINNKLKIKMGNLDKVDILNKVREKSENEIIDKIYLDDVEITVDYFKSNNIDLTELERIEFKTKEVKVLVEETLIQAQDYLPKLTETLTKTAKFYEENNLDVAANYLDACLNGIEWYIGAMTSIYNLIENEEVSRKGKNLLKRLDEANSRALVALQKENFNYLSVIIEVEIVEKLKKIDNLNEILL